jgi:lipopolysaccharide transport system permease protein
MARFYYFEPEPSASSSFTNQPPYRVLVLALVVGNNSALMNRLEAESTDFSPPAQGRSGTETVALPAVPLLVIDGGRAWAAIDWRDLWGHRDLFYFLAWRDVKVRYKQTVLGVLWVVLQPLLTMVVFTLLFGRLAHLPSDGLPYAIFSYSGLLAWNFFNAAVGTSANSLLVSSNLLSKVYFPRLLLPAASVAATLVDFTIAALLLLGLLPWYGVALSPNLLWLPALGLIDALAALSIGLGLSALMVKYRDVRYALPFVLQLWMFLTPVIYPASFVPPNFRWLLLLNPLTGIIQAFRAVIADRPMPWLPLALAVAIVAGLLVISATIFQRMEREFADLI